MNLKLEMFKVVVMENYIFDDWMINNDRDNDDKS